MQLVLNNITEGIIVTDENNSVLYINDSAKRLLNLQNIDNISLYAILPIKDTNSKSNILINYHDKVISVNIQYVYYENFLIKLLLLTDITKQQKTEEELFIFKSYIESSVNQGIMVFDSEGKLIHINNHASKNEELPSSEVLGKRLEEIYDQTIYNQQRVSETKLVYKTGKPILDTIMHYRTNKGKNIKALCSIYPIIKEGKTVAIVCVTRYNNDIRSLLTKTIELQKQLLSTKRINTNGTRFSFNDIIGNSNAIKLAVEKAKKASFSQSPVLIYGETGTGKELFAQSIHNASIFKDKPFVAINCAAIPEPLLESILFGTVKGAFTGAEDTIGLFEQAEDGTIFLDEINSMPISLQVKLLRVLQEKMVRRIGAKNEIPIRCRIISASSEDPLECVKKNTIRDDLYYRLSVITIKIPPLRERNGDIILLANYFIQKYAQIYGKTKIKMSADFQEALNKYSWPGNVRELEHTIESSIIMLEDGEELSIQHLPPHLKPKFIANTNSFAFTSSASTLKELLSSFEKEVILNTLQNHKWNISRSAKALNIRRSNLQYRMRKLEIKKP